MKKRIALIVTVLIAIPGLAQAENSFRPASPGPGFMGHNAAAPLMWRSQMIPHRQRSQAYGQALTPQISRSNGEWMSRPMSSRQHRQRMSHQATAPQWGQRRFSARQVMRPPMPNRQHGQRMSQQRYTPQWNQRHFPARQAMRPLMPNRQQYRQRMPRRAQAPQWNQQRFLARQAMRPPMPNRQQYRQRMPRQAQAPQWNPRQALMAKQRTPHYPLYQSSTRPAHHNMYRWPQGNRYLPGVQYKRSGNQQMTQLSAVKRPMLASPWQTQKRLIQMQAPSSKLPVRGASYLR